ncbi:MAG: sugar phosphate nucleotidyltransferase [bacterium]
MTAFLMKAIIMAGGQGTRLQPFTHTIPKPLLPVGRKPIMQIIIEQFRDFGFTDIAITTGYKADLIAAYFQDGKNFGVNIRYVVEEKQLGTAGGLGKLKEWLDQPTILINGDILTKTDFKKMYQYHLDHNQSILTIGVKQQSFPIPFGVAELKENKIIQVTEKPTLTFPIIAGIYIVSPEIVNYISGNEYLDITDVIKTLIRDKKEISIYTINKYWKDIGRIDDFDEVLKENTEW